MTDHIRDVEGDEAKMVLAQFLGQSIGHLKEIDRNIVSGNNTLRGLTMNPVEVIEKLGSSNAPQLIPVQPIPVQPAIQFPVSHNIPQVSTSVVQNNGQLEMSFDYNVAKDIADRLTALERMVKDINKNITSILTIIQVGPTRRINL